MNEQPKLFFYRAITFGGSIIEGKEEANDFPSLALSLRRSGLQVIEATIIPGARLAEDRLEKMKQRINLNRPRIDLNRPQTKQTLWLPIRLLLTPLNWLFHRRSNTIPD